MSRWLITNARLVNEGKTIETDVRIERGRIDRVDRELSARPRETVVNARGRFLLPGMIDSAVHFREPGDTHKGNIATESRAAVAGGVTTFMDLPDTRPATCTRPALADKFSRANGRSAANFTFYLGADPADIETARQLHPGEACGLVVQLDGSQPAEQTGRWLSELARVCALPILALGEDRNTVEAGLSEAVRGWHGRIPPELHPQIHSAQAARAVLALAVRAADAAPGRLHLPAIGSRAELELLETGPPSAKQATAGTSIPGLYFMDADYQSLGNLIKCDPPVRTDTDRRELRRALAEGRLDLISSGHAPHLLREKGGHYESAASGMPVIQFALPAAWSLVAAHALSPERLVEKIAHNPARRFAIAERGFVREGYWADLVLIDDRKRCVVADQVLISQCGWTPFAGRKLPASVSATWVNGKLVWRDGLLTGLVPGQRVDFDRS